MRIIVAILFAVVSFGAWAKPAPIAKPVPIAAIKKPKLLRSNPHRYSAIQFAGKNPWDAVDDEDIVDQRRYRSRLEKEIDSDELSDYVRTRLLVARTRALKKFVEVHTSTV